MVLVSKRGLAVLYIIALAFLLSCGIYGYRQLHFGLSGTAAKLAAERLLYASIVGSLLISAFMGHLYLHRVRLEKKLRRLATLGGTASPLRQLRSGQFGSFGRSLEILYRRIMEVNEQQAIKLSGQSDLISLLMSNSNTPTAVTDITGRLLYSSENYEKRVDMSRSTLIGSSIEALEEEIVVPMVLQKIEERRSFSAEKEGAMEEKGKSSSYTVLPVFDKRGEVCYLLFDFSTISPFSSLKTKRTPHFAAAGKTKGAQENQRNPLRWLSQRLPKDSTKD
jgi:PAS domain-containing protein